MVRLQSWPHPLEKFAFFIFFKVFHILFFFFFFNITIILSLFFIIEVCGLQSERREKKDSIQHHCARRMQDTPWSNIEMFNMATGALCDIKLSFRWVGT